MTPTLDARRRTAAALGGGIVRAVFVRGGGDDGVDAKSVGVGVINSRRISDNGLANL